MNGRAQIDSTHIHWETPKGSKPWGKTTIEYNGKIVPLCLNVLKEKFQLKLDPCANNREASMCDTYYTPKDDGLSKPWNLNAIFNPPFADVDKWVAKAVIEATRHPVTIIGVLPAYISTPWFHDCIWDILPKENIIPIKGRMQYWDPIEKRTGSPNFDQFLAIWRSNHGP